MVEFSMFPENDPKFPADDSLEPRVRDKASSQLFADAGGELDDLINSFKKKEEDQSEPAVNPPSGEETVDPTKTPTLDELLNSATEDTSFSSKASGVLKSVARGVGSGISTLSDVVTSSTLHGPLQAVDSMIDLSNELGAGWLAERMEEIVPLGGYQLFDKDGNFSFKLLSPHEYKFYKEKGAEVIAPSIPDKLVDFFGPRTVAGDIASTLSQFAVSMYVGGRVVPMVGPQGGWLLRTGREMGRGGLATFIGFKAHEERLSNLIQQYPSLQNPVTEFLAAKEETPALLDRLKAAVEGEAMGPVGQGIFKTFVGSLRLMKKIRAGIAGRAAPKVVEAAQTAGHRFIKDMYALGGVEWSGKIYRAGDIKADEFGSKTEKFTVGKQEAGNVDALNEIAENRARRKEIYDQALKDIEAGTPGNLSTKEKADAWLKYYDDLDAEREAKVKKGSPGTEVEETRAGVFFHTDRDGAAYYGQVNNEFDNFQLNNPLVIDISGDPAAKQLAKKYGLGYFPVDRLLKAAKIESSGDVATDIEQLLPHVHKIGKYDGVIISGDTGAEVTGFPLEVVLFKDPRLKPEHATSKVVQYTDPDNIIGDVDAPLIGNKPTGLPKKLQDVLEKASGDDITPDEIKFLATGATPIKIGKEPVYINFAHINSEAEVQQVIQHLANEAKTNIDVSKRAVASWAKTGERASALDGWQLVLERRRGEAWNAEKMVATRELWITAAHKVLAMSKLVAKDPRMENVYAARRMTAIFQLINAEVLGATAEAGRALNILRKPVGVSGDALPAYLQTALDQVGGKEMNEQFFRNLAAMADDPDAYSKLSEKVEPTAMQRVVGGLQDFWIGGSLLSGPKTQMRNLLSNLGTTVNEALEREIAGRVSKMLGDETSSHGEGLAYLVGATNAIKQGVVAAGRAAWRNESTFSATQFDAGPSRLTSSGTPIEGTPLGWAIDALGAYSSLSSRAMVSADEFFKTINYSGSLSYLAHREAMEELSRGVISREQVNDRIAELMAHPTNQMKMQSWNQAHYATFTSPPGEVVKALLRVSSIHPTMRWVAPFIRTPANLFKYAIERSPLGFLTKRYKDAINAGGHEATLARTRIGFGTIVMLSALDLALEGKIVGDPAEYVTSPSEKDWIRSNSMPYSLRIPMGDNDVRHFSYQGLDPIGLTLGAAANMAEAVKASQDGDFDEEDEENLGKAMVGFVFYAANYALSKSYMTGFADVVQAATDPNYNAERWANKFAASWIPNWMAEWNRAIDPIIRDSSDLTNAIMRKTLFMSGDVPAVRDRFGRTSSYESGLGSAYDTLSPLYSKRVQTSPWEQEEKRQGFYVGAPSSTLTIDKVKVKLGNNPAMYLELKRIRGQMKPSEMGGYPEAKRLEDKYGDYSMFDLLNAIVEGNHPLYLEYAGRSDGKDNEKDAFIDKIVRDYTKAAKTKLFNENVQLQMMYEMSAKRRITRDEQID